MPQVAATMLVITTDRVMVLLITLPLLDPCMAEVLPVFISLSSVYYFLPLSSLNSLLLESAEVLVDDKRVICYIYILKSQVVAWLWTQEVFNLYLPKIKNKKGLLNLFSVTGLVIQLFYICMYALEAMNKSDH